MAITESQKSLTVCTRDKNPPKPMKPQAKPGPKPGQKPGTAARFRKDERHQDLTYHDWVQTQRTRTPRTHRPSLLLTFPPALTRTVANCDLLNLRCQKISNERTLGWALRDFRAAMAQEGEENKVQTSITSLFK
ncbi:hypothetical protein B0H14DRAFT_2556162 [Mycena olivaceomarginata]|nr:hypothetical protein B0H14DRAFT_2556162 [Mycena olivaceomarginata]